jgi:hypothetical protein
MRCGDQVLPPVLDPLDRTAQLPGGQHHRRLLPEHEHLLAEATADVSGRDPDVRLGDAEIARHVVARLVDTLAGAGDVDLVASRLPVGHDAACLHRHTDVPVLFDGRLRDVSRT